MQAFWSTSGLLIPHAKTHSLSIVNNCLSHSLSIANNYFIIFPYVLATKAGLII